MVCPDEWRIQWCTYELNPSNNIRHDIKRRSRVLNIVATLGVNAPIHQIIRGTGKARKTHVQ